MIFLFSLINCGEKISCMEKSIKESAICKPIIKKSTAENSIDDVLLNLIILCFIGKIFVVVCDQIYHYIISNDALIHQQQFPAVWTIIPFSILYFSVFVYLSASNFDSNRFCELNMNERICHINYEASYETFHVDNEVMSYSMFESFLCEFNERNNHIGQLSYLKVNFKI